MVSTPKPWLPSFHPDLCPPSLSRRGLGGRAALAACWKGGVNLPLPEIPGWPFPLASPQCPLFSGGESCQHAPLCAHPPQGTQAWAHPLICG